MIECPRDRSINITYVEAPIERVWRAVATPNGSNSYLTDRVDTTGDPDMPHVGDRLTLYYGDIINRAVILEVKPWHTFILADAYESMAPDGTIDPFHVKTSYIFKSEGVFTKMILTVEGYADNTHGQWFRECLEMGWRRSLANLKGVLELGMDLRTELFSYPRLGITNCTVNASQSKETGVPPGEGNYLLDVFPSGPAEVAGLCPGDVITAVGDVPVRNYRSYVRAISRYYGASEPVDVIYIRDGNERNAQVAVSIDRMFTGLIEGTDESLEIERARRQRIASERSASGAIWRTAGEEAATNE